MRILYYIFQLTWGLPQNICGLLLWGLLSLRDALANEPPPHKAAFRDAPPLPRFWHGAVVIPWHHRGSMALGMFIFLGISFRRDPESVLAHEFGHTIQSVLLGPTYLLIIGVCSFLWSQLPHFRRMRRERQISYYSFWPERWANALGLWATGVHGPER